MECKVYVERAFFGRPHPKYQDIELYDTLQYFAMPPKVKKLYDENASASVSENPSTGQGFEKNRLVKDYIPGRNPSDGIWLSGIRNSDTLETMHKQTLSSLGIKDDPQSAKTLDVNAAINAWRVEVRKRNVTSWRINCTCVNERKCIAWRIDKLCWLSFL